MTGNARSSGYDRAANDWYIEPKLATERLLDAELFTGPVWDPACGGGNIPAVCRSRGLKALASDLVDRGAPECWFGDFLTVDVLRVTANEIITNPPFSLAEQFVHRAISLVQGKVAILARTAFLEGQGRLERLFKPTPPARIWQFASRISMPPGGSQVEAKNGSTAFCWIVWDPEYRGAPAFGWLP